MWEKIGESYRPFHLREQMHPPLCALKKIGESSPPFAKKSVGKKRRELPPFNLREKCTPLCALKKIGESSPPPTLRKKECGKKSARVTPLFICEKNRRELPPPLCGKKCGKKSARVTPLLICGKNAPHSAP